MTNTNAELAAALREAVRMSSYQALIITPAEAELIIAALEAAEGKAEAWDDGWSAGSRYVGEMTDGDPVVARRKYDEDTNPYRSAP